MSTENLDMLYDIITSFTDIFTEHKVTFKVTKLKSEIDLYFYHEISGHITISLIFDNYNLNIAPKARKIGDIQLSKLINKNFKTLHTDNFIEILEYSAKTVPTITNYCVGCSTLLEIESKLYINCGKDLCVYECEELPIGNYICNAVKTQPIVTEFLLETGIESALSSRRLTIFEPFPHYFLKTEKQMTRGELTALCNTSNQDEINKLKDFKSLDATLTTPFFKIRPFKNMITTLLKYDTDVSIEEDLGTDVYNLLRFFIMSAEFEINEVQLFNPSELKTLSNPKTSSKQFRQYMLKHLPEKEAVFTSQANKQQTCYLFHGSGRENWYSIMRNGLKVASHTKVMVNAAAYGRGIYTSTNFEVSLHYTKTYNKTTCIMGVFEAASPTPDKWRKASDIYVVPEAEDLILRYIVVVPPKMHNNVGNMLNVKFGQTLKEEEKVYKVTLAKRSSKRIMSELKKMQKPSTRELGFSVEPKDDDISIWNAYMHIDGFDADQALTKSLSSNEISYVQFEIHFPDRYPFEPPFVRVVSPRFKYRTGHITINGAICHKILSNENWSPGCYIQTLLMDIRCNIMIGEAELEPTLWNTEYSFSAAKSDYIRVMKSHGWK